MAVMGESGRPEIGALADAAGIKTNYLTAGDGPPVVLIHDAEPGVTAYANWRLMIPGLATRFRVIAPDLAGFGFSERPDGLEYGLRVWVDQAVGLIDGLGLERVHLVGAGLGGAIAIRLAAERPDRVGRLALIASLGLDVPITEGLDRVWGYRPSFDGMRRVLEVLAHSTDLVTDELALIRYRGSVQPGFQESFATMFPADESGSRQRWVEALRTPDTTIGGLPHRTLILHGRDDRVIPRSAGYELETLLPQADLVMLSGCGHWPTIERAATVNRLVADFLADDRTAT